MVSVQISGYIVSFLLILLTAIRGTDGARILGVFHMPGQSHFILGEALMTELANRGHEVTMVAPFRAKNPPKNYREIYIPDIVDDLEDFKKELSNTHKLNIFQKLNQIFDICKFLEEKTLENQDFTKLLENEKFDLVILELMLNDAMVTIADRLNCPLIALSPVGSNLFTNDLTGNLLPYSFIPDFMSSFPLKMSLRQRFMNTLLGVIQNIYRYTVYLPSEEEIANRLLKPSRPFYDILYNNVSLVLLNSHVSLGQPKPLTPNMIEIGGFHIKPPKPLPKDLQDFLDGSEEGAIYFSLGSNFKSTSLPEEKRIAILNTFKRLPYKIIWKWETDTLPGQPSNVHLVKWAPQQDILAHRNIKLFITHGGLLSTTEAIYHGVPLVAIPIFAEQNMNAQTAVYNGYALSVPFAELTEDRLYKAVTEALAKPTIRENAKLRSKMMHDQPLKPMDNAVFWIEYVLRFKGASHFRSTALDLKLYQYFLLDVIGIYLAIVGVAVGLLYVIIKMCKRALRKKCTPKKKTQ